MPKLNQISNSFKLSASHKHFSQFWVFFHLDMFLCYNSFLITAPSGRHLYLVLLHRGDTSSSRSSQSVSGAVRGLFNIHKSTDCPSNAKIACGEKEVMIQKKKNVSTASPWIWISNLLSQVMSTSPNSGPLFALIYFSATRLPWWHTLKKKLFCHQSFISFNLCWFIHNGKICNYFPYVLYIYIYIYIYIYTHTRTHTHTHNIYKKHRVFFLYTYIYSIFLTAWWMLL